MNQQCELCEKEVHGEMGVFDGEIGGIGVVIIKETSKRDWILCDSCNVLVCHSCCTRPETGYCNACIDHYKLNFDEEERLVDQ